MAVISLDLASTATWPEHQAVGLGPGADQVQRGLAEGRGRGSGAASCRRWPPPCPRSAAATRRHPAERKPASNCTGSSAAKTRPKVSCDGMPLGSSRKRAQPVGLAYR